MLEGLPPNNAAHMLRLITEEEPARQLAKSLLFTVRNSGQRRMKPV
jgi:hypothetical protein